MSRLYFSPLKYYMFITLHTGALLREKVDTVKAPIFTSLLLSCFSAAVFIFCKKDGKQRVFY